MSEQYPEDEVYDGPSEDLPRTNEAGAQDDLEDDDDSA